MSDCNCDLSGGFNPDIEKLNFECKKTWDLICSGNTVGCFQLESRLGRTACKRARPRNLDELSDVITIIRPASLEAKLSDGKNITEHYYARKSREEPVQYYHPALEPILKDTYGLLLTQEQTIRIGQELAGMSESVADKLLRKGIGKKVASLIAEAKIAFVNGAEQLGKISRQEAEDIFAWIAAGARYGFNKSVTGNTTVTTPEGEKRINEVRPGDQVKTAEGYANVVNCYDHGIQDVYKVTLNCGSQIECTLDHKFLCADDIIRPLVDIVRHGWEICVHNYDTKTCGASRIENIKHLGKQQTYDIEIDTDNHLFLANGGIVTSNSHAISYAYVGYQTAYAKAHFPKEFYISYLNNSKSKQKAQFEIASLYEDARKNGVQIDAPDIRNKNKDFEAYSGGIRFGLGHIKSVGDKAFAELKECLAEDVAEYNATECIFKILLKTRKNVAKILIGAGCFDFLNVGRKKLIYFYDQAYDLKPKEVQYIEENCNLSKNTLDQCFKELLLLEPGRGEVFASQRRKDLVNGIYKSLTMPAFGLKDSIKEMSSWEESYLGVAISCSKFDLIPKSGTKCVEFEGSGDQERHTITAQVKMLNEIRDKNDEEMAFAIIADDSGTVENAVFLATNWAKCKDIVRPMRIYKFRGIKEEARDSFKIHSAQEVII